MSKTVSEVLFIQDDARRFISRLDPKVRAAVMQRTYDHVASQSNGFHMYLIISEKSKECVTLTISSSAYPNTHPRVKNDIRFFESNEGWITADIPMEEIVHVV